MLIRQEDAPNLLYNNIPTNPWQEICSAGRIFQGYYLQAFKCVYGEGVGRRLGSFTAFWIPTLINLFILMIKGKLKRVWGNKKWEVRTKGKKRGFSVLEKNQGCQ